MGGAEGQGIGFGFGIERSGGRAGAVADALLGAQHDGFAATGGVLEYGGELTDVRGPDAGIVSCAGQQDGRVGGCRA